MWTVNETKYIYHVSTRAFRGTPWISPPIGPFVQRARKSSNDWPVQLRKTHCTCFDRKDPRPYQINWKVLHLFITQINSFVLASRFYIVIICKSSCLEFRLFIGWKFTRGLLSVFRLHIKLFCAQPTAFISTGAFLGKVLSYNNASFSTWL